MSFTPAEYYDWIKGEIWKKTEWLQSHATKWPEHDVEAKRHDLAILTGMKEAYDRKFNAEKDVANG